MNVNIGKATVKQVNDQENGPLLVALWVVLLVVTGSIAYRIEAVANAATVNPGVAIVTGAIPTGLIPAVKPASMSGATSLRRSIGIGIVTAAVQ